MTAIDTIKSTSPTLIIAAPASGSGKTIFTLALLRHLRQRGLRVRALKVGPDYIDPMFHAVASGNRCDNLDIWAMREQTLASLIMPEKELDICLVEGVMGLFDGARASIGSTAEVAVRYQWPILLIVDASGMAASIQAVIHGFDTFFPNVRLAGVILNRVSSKNHAFILREALASSTVPVLGCIPRSEALILPDRHLGLVPANEHPRLENFLNAAAQHIAEHVAVDDLLTLARDSTDFAAPSKVPPAAPLLPPAQVIALAVDEAFAFCYPWLIDSWRSAGAEVIPFSPLANQVPSERAEYIYLPGGYPELHADTIAANRNFLEGLRASAKRGTRVWGECGGYMVLGEALIDAAGIPHTMAELLPLTTSFFTRSLSLGYRTVRTRMDSPLGTKGAVFKGHEFHYSTIVQSGSESALFDVKNAGGHTLGVAGHCHANVAGSYIHLIDRGHCRSTSDQLLET